MGDTADKRRDELRVQTRAVSVAGLEGGEQALVSVLRDIEREQQRAADSYRAVVRSLAAALEARDGYTGGHSDRVHQLAVAVGHRLGLSAASIDEISTVALLHDIGKIGVPDHVLHKRGPLDPDEWELMRQHPLIGERILRPLPGLSAVATAVRHEHERWDGSGYPDGLAGEAIPLSARVVLACDAWHALVSDRPYRTALRRDSALAELRRGAGSHFDPRVVDALIACLEDPQPAHGEPADDVLPAIGSTAAAGEARLQAELRALIGVAGAVAAVHKLDDVIETAAEEARRALGSDSLSISRLELDRYQLRTLVNVGELGPGEERLPEDEVYPLSDYPRLMDMLQRTRAHVVSADDPDADPAERELLASLGKAYAIAVPIVFADRMWGELYATRSADPFGERDVRFLQAISGQIAAAIGRAEMFTRMAELAFEDSLTGLANRRALDERLERSVAAALRDGRDLSLVLCDVDNLKQINDGAGGHQAGDAALIRVGEVLREAAAGTDGLVARLGGDEFCIVVEDTEAGDARTLAERALDTLIAGDDEITLSAGVASLGTGARRPADLMRAADSALYTAKRAGRRRVYVARADDVRAESSPRNRRVQPSVRLAAELHRALGEALAQLDALPLPALERLSAVMMRLAVVADARAWVISHVDADSRTLRTVHFADTRVHSHADLWVDVADDSRSLDDHPARAEIVERGGSFSMRADDPDADPDAMAILGDGVVHTLAAAAAPWDGGCWLVELYGDTASADPALVEPYLRLLAAEAVRGAELPDPFPAQELTAEQS